jgi:hypothetical protein
MTGERVAIPPVPDYRGMRVLEQPAGRTLINLDDGVAVRTYLESLRAQMESDRATWDPHWQDLTAFFAPRAASWDYSDTNIGNRRDSDLINETAIECRHTLAAGMASGMTPQASKWFSISADDDALDQDLEVRDFCEKVEAKVRKVFLKSNVYSALLNLYDEEGFLGTSAFLLLEDKQTVVRAYEYQIGRYYLSTDNTRRVSILLRVLYMTASQIVEEFGYKNCSTVIQNLYNSPAGGNKEVRQPVVHVILKGDHFQEVPGKPNWPWVETYYEMGAYSQGQKYGLLRQGGYPETPFMIGRWRVMGENVYAECPGMDCLGSVMSLQSWEDRTAQGVERQLNPALVASTEVDPRKLTTLPGDIIFVNSKDASKALTSAYQVDFHIEGAIKMIERIEARIQTLMYSTIFQAVTDAEREKTAEEVRALQQEKMHVLGPVVERNVEEVLQPLVVRTIGILERRGELPPIPPQMRMKNGSVRKFKLEFVSILAKAQRMAGINTIVQWVQFAASQAAASPDALDVVNMPEAIREYGDLADVPAHLIRSKEEAQKMADARNQAAQQAQAAKNANMMAPAVTAAASAKPDGTDLISKMLPGLAGAQAAGGAGGGPP